MSPENDATSTTDSTHAAAASDRDVRSAGAQSGSSDQVGSDDLRANGVESQNPGVDRDGDFPGSKPGSGGGGEFIAGENDTAGGASSVAEGVDFGASEGGSDESEESNESLQARLAIAEDQAAAHWDRLLRLQADVENQRKRAQRELVNARKFALEGIVGDLLPIRDSLEMGIAAAQAEGGSIEKLLEGTDLTLKMLAQAFDKHNIVEVNPLDEKFNPEFHEAMSMQEVAGKATNTVTAVLQKGYTLNERLIRPALVVVAR